jgi:hypothetical protein
MYLDFYLEDGARIAPHKKHTQNKTLDGVIVEAIRHVNLSGATSGYVGIFKDEGGKFVGFIVKIPGHEPYFDDDETVCPVDYRFHN